MTLADIHQEVGVGQSLNNDTLQIDHICFGHESCLLFLGTVSKHPEHSGWL
jgi:hypothetical protein